MPVLPAGEYGILSVMSKRAAFTLAAIFGVTSGIWASRDNWIMSFLFAFVALLLAVLDRED